MKTRGLRRRIGWTLLLLSACLIWGSTSYAADVAETARASAAKYQKAVVTVRLVVKLKTSMRGQNQDEEQKVEATGFVIDPSGLTVADASSLDPVALLKPMLASMGGMGLQIDSEIKEAMILLDDGAEVEADVVLTDAELGLAFLRPRNTARKFDAVVLKQRDAPPQLLDSVIVLGRHGKLGNRAVTLAIDSIRSVVKGPRPFYTSDKLDTMGCLAFAANGDALGLYVTKPKQGAGEEGGMGSPMRMLANLGEMKNMLMLVIRPVNDLIEIAAQAKQAKPPTKSVPEAETPAPPKTEP